MYIKATLMQKLHSNTDLIVAVLLFLFFDFVWMFDLVQNRKVCWEHI